MPTDVQGLALLGNALALPKRLENASQQSAMLRAIFSKPENAATLAEMGLTPAQIEQLTPDPGLGAINPAQHPGTYGKILQGVGGVGNVISSLLGSPIEPPRMELSTITALSGLRDKSEKKKALGQYAETLPDAGSKALALAGYPASAAKVNAPSKGSTQELGVLIQEGVDDGLSLPEARKRATKQFNENKTNRAVAQGQAMSPILAERGQAAAETEVSKQIRLDAVKQLRQIGDIEERVLPMMDLAQKSLSSNPAFAATVQPAYLWMKALGGDEAANAMQQLPTQIPSLARLSDVGNLSEPEQAVWRVFLKGDNMTAQQFSLVRVALKKVLGSVARRAHKAYISGQIDLPKSLTEDPNAAGGGAGGQGPDELDQLLQQHGH